MLKLALENEVEEYIQRYSDEVGKDGKRIVVKNGSMPKRDIVTGMGPHSTNTAKSR
jgi:hypothetical protein